MDAEISADGSFLTVSLLGGHTRFHACWLRDNARDEKTISPSNGQRLITLLDQPESLSIVKAHVLPSEFLSVRFNCGDTDYLYPFSWLEKNRYDYGHLTEKGWTSCRVQRWGSELQGKISGVDYNDALTDPQVLKNWLGDISRLGFARMSGLRDDPDALLDAVALFGFVRETNYGRTFDVRSEINPVNLAYTSLGLQAHTDNPYRDPVPTLQFLACVENTADGGESIVVDGFKVAGILQQENPEHFDLLARFCARFKYAGSADACLESKRPMIELGPDGELIAVRFNNRSASPFSDIPFDNMSAYYSAYRHFVEIIERQEVEVTFRLSARELFVVDNTRVLHSRNAFSGSGVRWLRGCYADKDGLLSKLAILEQSEFEP